MKILFEKYLRDKELARMYIESLMKTLTREEIAIIKILINLESAQTIKSIRNMMVHDAAYGMYGLWCEKFLNKNNKHRIRWKTKIKELNIIYRPIVDLSDKTLKPYGTVFCSILKESKGVYRILKLGHLLSNYNIKVASQGVIENSLENLLKMELIGHRKAEDRKTKGLWFVNPEFDMIITNLSKDSRKNKFIEISKNI